MIIDLQRLKEPNGRLTEEEDVYCDGVFDEKVLVHSRLDLEYQHTGGAFYFHCELSGEISTACHSCLEPTPHSFGGEFDVVVRKGTDRAAGQIVADGEYFITLGQGEHTVLFDSLVVENLVVNLPMRVLCRADCRGLCENCGANRNVTSCTCRPAPDGRWGALKRSGPSASE